MSKQILWVIIVVLLSVLLAIVVKFVFLGSTAIAEDGRVQVLLDAGERDQVLGDMRRFLATTQQIVEGLSEHNMTKIETAASAVGMQATQKVDMRLKAKLPIAFKQLGFATHRAFDDIATMAKEKQGESRIQIKLADTMNNCVACHSSYQLPVLSHGLNH